MSKEKNILYITDASLKVIERSFNWTGQNDSYVHGRQGLYSSHMNNGRSDNEYLLVMGR